MVGTSNLGFWNGQWTNDKTCISKSNCIKSTRFNQQITHFFGSPRTPWTQIHRQIPCEIHQDSEPSQWCIPVPPMRSSSQVSCRTGSQVRSPRTLPPRVLRKHPGATILVSCVIKVAQQKYIAQLVEIQLWYAYSWTMITMLTMVYGMIWGRSIDSFNFNSWKQHVSLGNSLWENSENSQNWSSMCDNRRDLHG